MSTYFAPGTALASQDGDEPDKIAISARPRSIGADGHKGTTTGWGWLHPGAGGIAVSTLQFPLDYSLPRPGGALLKMNFSPSPPHSSQI